MAGASQPSEQTMAKKVIRFPEPAPEPYATTIRFSRGILTIGEHRSVFDWSTGKFRPLTPHRAPVVALRPVPATDSGRRKRLGRTRIQK